MLLKLPKGALYMFLSRLPSICTMSTFGGLEASNLGQILDTKVLNPLKRRVGSSFSKTYAYLGITTKE
jgi:hypothetical protein